MYIVSIHDKDSINRKVVPRTWSLKPSIDSLNIRIPLSEVEIVDNSLRDHIVEFNCDTGAFVNGSLDDEGNPAQFKQQAMSVKDDDGRHTRYLLKKFALGKSKGAEFVEMLINAKLLGTRYHEGIHRDNIRALYDTLIKQAVVSFPFVVFMQAHCTDVDIKRDYIMQDAPTGMDNLIDILKERTKARKEKRGGLITFKEKMNMGIQWSCRQEATTGLPYMKIYYKYFELIKKSILFTEHVLKWQIPKGLVRQEGTIKARKHWQSLTKSETDLTLDNLLALTHDDLNQILKIMISQHVDIKQPKKEIDKDAVHSLADGFCSAYLSRCPSKALAREEIADFMCTKEQTYTARKKIDTIWDERFGGTEKHQAGADADLILEAMGMGEN